MVRKKTGNAQHDTDVPAGEPAPVAPMHVYPPHPK
jgi:hypothetical protein